MQLFLNLIDVGINFKRPVAPQTLMRVMPQLHDCRIDLTQQIEVQCKHTHQYCQRVSTCSNMAQHTNLSYNIYEES